jgi:hypothetical protein
VGQSLLIRTALYAAVLAGCYSPGVERCLYQCGANRSCPNNLTCNTDNWCASSTTDLCEDVPDAPPTCGWATSNIDACAEGYDKIETANWIVNGAEMIDTSGIGLPAIVPAGTMGGLMNQLGGGTNGALVIAVHDFTVAGTLTVKGKRPLIILANGNVTITGEVHLDPAGDDDTVCAGKLGDIATGTSGGGGGGGGSMGGPGANGGSGGRQAGSGIIPIGGPRGFNLDGANELALTPLRGGCKGGSGGGLGTNVGGRGGFAGGSIQISARTRITIEGIISANGGGGQTTSTSQHGAGGGGSGGAIFLESPMVAVIGAKLCANGGGGGGTFGPAATGKESDCGPSPAMGANNGGNFDNGGSGATGNIIAGIGYPGMNTSSTPGHGGGGGGGGVGRIRIPGMVTTSGSPVVSPAITK